MCLPGAGARGDHRRAEARGGGKRLMRRQVQPPSAGPCLAPCPWYQPPSPKSGNHSPPCKREVDGRGS